MHVFFCCYICTAHEGQVSLLSGSGRCTLDLPFVVLCTLYKLWIFSTSYVKCPSSFLISSCHLEQFKEHTISHDNANRIKYSYSTSTLKMKSSRLATQYNCMVLLIFRSSVDAMLILDSYFLESPVMPWPS